MHEIAAHELAERKRVANAAIDALDELQRSRQARLVDEDVRKRADSITQVLLQATLFPRPSDFKAIADHRKSTNVGLEIEIAQLEIEAKAAGKQGPVKPSFLKKCMLEEKPKGYSGFSVQSDGGHIELVSDPPNLGQPPADTAAAMGRYIEKLQKDLLSDNTGVFGRVKELTGPWLPARAAVPVNGRHERLQDDDGKDLDVRIRMRKNPADAKKPVGIDGTFHATVGLHLSAIPWLFASGADASVDDRQELKAFPLYGHLFRRRDDRYKVFGQIAALRQQRVNGVTGWDLSPEFEGLACLVFAYLAAARTGAPKNAPKKTLSPKQHFYVLARTDFPAMLRLTPEFRSGDEMEIRNLGTAVKSAASVEAAASLDQSPMFDDVFTDEALPGSPRVKLSFKGQTWIELLFSTNSVDMLTADYWTAHPDLSNPIDPALFRGMGALGNKTDPIAGATGGGMLDAPLLELRRITPDAAKPDLSEWESRTRRIVDTVSALNAPASNADKIMALEELDWIRRTGVPRFGNLAGRDSKDAHREVADFCQSIRPRIGNSQLRADLWTLLDRARGFTEIGARARD